VHIVIPNNIDTKQRATYRCACKAFTLIEVILVVAILGITASFIIPRLDLDVLGKLDVQTHSARFANSLRVARSMAIMHASTNSSGYKVKLSNTSPYNAYQIINGANTMPSKEIVTLPSALSCTGVSEISFNGLGNSTAGSSQVVQFSESGTCYQVTVWPVGGRIEVSVCP